MLFKEKYFVCRAKQRSSFAEEGEGFHKKWNPGQQGGLGRSGENVRWVCRNFVGVLGSAISEITPSNRPAAVMFHEFIFRQPFFRGAPSCEASVVEDIRCDWDKQNYELVK